MKSESGMPIEIPFRTVMTVLLTLAFVQIFSITAPLILTVIIGGMVAVSLEPLAGWLTEKGLPRWLSVTVIALMLIGLIAAFMAFIAPKIYSQSIEVYNQLPHLKQELLGRLQDHPGLRAFFEKNLRRDALMPKAMNLKEILGAGNEVLGGLVDALLVFVFAVYLLADGPRILEWISAFFQPATQEKIDQTNREVSRIVSAYVAGQVITSVLSFIYVFVVLSWMGVPNVLLLATISGVMDVLPVLGFVFAVIPAMFFALEISFPASIFVLGLYLLYHAIENYFIVPVVYGKRLRVSGFVVFLGLLIAGLVAGIKGAIAILPFLAAYPVIEKIWLKNVVRKEALAAHKPG
jgi:predicted PurR-regulated permease PerM